MHAFYQHVPAADVVARAPSDLSEAALSLWRFAAERQPGRPKIRVLSPSGTEEAWIGGHTILQVVNDDMPFLMDSVTAALIGLGLDVQLIIHPVLSVQRDGAGLVTGCGPDVTDGIKELMLHIELTGDIDGERRAAIIGRLEMVLADVRSAADDLPAMRKLVEQLAQEVDSLARPGPTPEAAEAAGFLRWLAGDKFHFFGYREYALSELGLDVVPGSGKGLLRSDAYLVFDGLRALTQIPPDLQAFLRSPQLTMVSKSNRRSTVHRPVPMDAILIKKFNRAGDIAGLTLLLGLFTAGSYLRPPRDIPVLRQKVRRCQEHSGFAPDSRDATALQHILDTFPRDELFQIDERQLFETALGILHLQQRPRVALFVLRDPFERFVTCLIYMPRDRYNAEIRSRMAAILKQAFNASLASDSTHFDEHNLARIHLVLTTTPGQVPDMSAAEIERQLIEAARAWIDRLSEAVVRARGAGPASEILRRFRGAFPANYVERFRAEAAVEDMKFIEQVTEGRADRGGARAEAGRGATPEDVPFGRAGRALRRAADAGESRPAGDQ